MGKHRKCNYKVKGEDHRRNTNGKPRRNTIRIFCITKEENKTKRKYTLIIILKSKGIKTDATSQSLMAGSKKNQYSMIKTKTKINEVTELLAY